MTVRGTFGLRHVDKIDASSRRAAFTPGPWHVQGIAQPGWTAIAGPKGEDLAIINASDGLDEPTHYPFVANARLMAAAPDLVEVAKEYEQWEADLIMDQSAWADSLPRIPQHLWDRFLEIQQKRNAALAKATGTETPSYQRSSEGTRAGGQQTPTQNEGE